MTPQGSYKLARRLRKCLRSVAGVCLNFRRSRPMKKVTTQRQQALLPDKDKWVVNATKGYTHSKFKWQLHVVVYTAAAAILMRLFAAFPTTPFLS